ncbi:cation:proton antiporter [Gordonia sp. FQ]|uniref:cation:proton antiporter n=1 Tax=Gordonia sp. FQ TaxID=3446634 RepID=UPI003F869293
MTTSAVAAEAAPFLKPTDVVCLLTQIAVLLGVAVLLGQAMRRLGMPKVVGEMLTGVLLGPSVLGLVWPWLEHLVIPSDPARQHLCDAVGQIGVILLVALAGTELDLGFVRRRRRAVASIGLIGMAVPALAGVGFGLWVPQAMRTDSPKSLFVMMIAAAISVSALPVIAQILTEMGLLHRNVGQIILVSASVKDAMTWILIAVASASATAGVTLGHISVITVVTLGAFAVTLFLLRPLAQPLLQRYEASPGASAGLFVPVCVVFVLACAALTQALHLEAILGAFLAGLVIGPRAPFLLAPLRTVTMTVLMPLFLANAGLRVDLTALADVTVALGTLALLVVAVTATFAGSFAGARVGGLSRWEATAVGSGLNARGAVEIIIATTGLSLGIFSAPMYTAVIIVAVTTSVMAPPMLKWSMRRIGLTDEEKIRIHARAEPGAREMAA